MNKYILENAAIYVNAYRDNFARNNRNLDAIAMKTLRERVSSMFGPVYAAILVR